MKILPNYSVYSNQNAMNTSFQSKFAPKKIASFAALMAVAGEIGYAASDLDSENKDDYNGIGIEKTSEHNSEKVQQYFDEIG